MHASGNTSAGPANRAGQLTGLALAFSLLAPPLAAFTLTFPGGAATTAERVEALGSYRMPISPWRDGGAAVLALEGPIRQTAIRLPSGSLTTLQLLTPLRAQLLAAGFRVLFECSGPDCGGFDFRYETEVLPEPDMHIDLGDFRYLAAERIQGTRREHLSLFVSRSSESGFVQVFQVGTADVSPSGSTAPDPAAEPDPADTTDPADPALPEPQPAVATGPLASALEAGGSVPLDDLAFPSGSAELAPGTYASLAELAAYLAANPALQVLLVGHTDAAGRLDGNIALSRRRAASVQERLVTEFGVARAQIGAEGVGYLAPRASNLTEAGRTRNRRVEVVLTSTP